MHLYSPLPGENEFNFDQEKFYNLIFQLSNDPIDFFRLTLTYFGHFGVQIFIFLSAYGLTLKPTEPNSHLRFIIDRMLKIYPAFIIAIILWSLKENLQFRPIGFEHGFFGFIDVIFINSEQLLYKLLLISPFIPGEAYSLVGPWWFIGFIFQFYLAFPLLRKFEYTFGGPGVVILSTLSIILTYLVTDLFPIYFTLLGHIPELLFGIYVARKGSLYIPNKAILFIVFLFIIGNMVPMLWHFNHISALILLLLVFQKTKDRLQNTKHLNSVISWLGLISLQLFLINGFLREPFLTLARNYDHWLATIIGCLFSFVTASIISYLALKAESLIRISISKHLS